MGVAIDSTFLVDFSRRLPAALNKLDELDSRTDPKILPTPVIYEFLTGILRSRSKTQATQFLGFAARFHVAPLDLASAERAAALRAELLDLGRIKGAADILTAGIALSGGHTLVTRDRDFGDIAGATGLSLETVLRTRRGLVLFFARVSVPGALRRADSTQHISFARSGGGAKLSLHHRRGGRGWVAPFGAFSGPMRTWGH